MTKFLKDLHFYLNDKYKVISALILREIITRWGRKNIGFLWIFGEQFLACIFYVLFWIFRGEFSNLVWAKYNISIIAFIILGHSTVMLWRNCVSFSMGAIWSNTQLFHHPQISAGDFYLARIALESISITSGFIITTSILVFTGIIPYPKNTPLMILAWIYLIWFTVGFSLIIGVLITQFEYLKQPWLLLSFILFITSGAFYPAQFAATIMPKKYFDILILIPPMQINEMMRHGYYGNLFPTYENQRSLCITNLIVLFLGVCLVNFYGKKLPQRL